MIKKNKSKIMLCISLVAFSQNSFSWVTVGGNFNGQCNGGYTACADYYSVAVGDNALATSSKTTSTTTNHTFNTAVGGKSNAVGGVGNSAFGSNSNADGNYTLTLGSYTKALGKNSVSLGSFSESDNEIINTTKVKLADVDYAFSGEKADSMVSLGRKGSKDIEEINRVITHLAAGRVSKESTDAINGSQVFAAYESINKINNDIKNGTLGLVRQDPSSKAITVAAETGGRSMSVAGSEGNRTLSGLKDGALKNDSSEAVNGSQLFATNTTVSNNTKIGRAHV